MGSSLYVVRPGAGLLNNEGKIFTTYTIHNHSPPNHHPGPLQNDLWGNSKALFLFKNIKQNASLAMILCPSKHGTSSSSSGEYAWADAEPSQGRPSKMTKNQCKHHENSSFGLRNFHFSKNFPKKIQKYGYKLLKNKESFPF